MSVGRVHWSQTPAPSPPRSGSGRSQEVPSPQSEGCGFSPARRTSLPAGLHCGQHWRDLRGEWAVQLLVQEVGPSLASVPCGPFMAPGQAYPLGAVTDGGGAECGQERLSTGTHGALRARRRPGTLPHMSCQSPPPLRADGWSFPLTRPKPQAFSSRVCPRQLPQGGEVIMPGAGSVRPAGRAWARARLGARPRPPLPPRLP